jgi:hypothetical protein
VIASLIALIASMHGSGMRRTICAHPIPVPRASTVRGVVRRVAATQRAEGLSRLFFASLDQSRFE